MGERPQFGPGSAVINLTAHHPGRDCDSDTGSTLQQQLENLPRQARSCDCSPSHGSEDGDQTACFQNHHHHHEIMAPEVHESAAGNSARGNSDVFVITVAAAGTRLNYDDCRFATHVVTAGSQARASLRVSPTGRYFKLDSASGSLDGGIWGPQLCSAIQASLSRALLSCP
eukprot:3261508-Rhodomonas_salina.1